MHNYIHDHLYSPVAMLNFVMGTVLERYEYDAYGNPTIMDASYNARNSSNYGNNYLFTGRSVDILDTSSLKIQHNRNRDLDYYTGRWYSHDPLGITPAGGDENIFFSPAYQYRDSFNLYEYVSSNPMIKSDPQGLIGLLPITFPSLIANQSKACCKGRSKTQVYMPLPGGGAYPKPSSECSQVTISKRLDQTAQQACNCYSEKRKNFDVYEAYEGPCCTCKIYLESGPLPVLGHYRIRVKCKNESFAITVYPDQLGAWDKSVVRIENPNLGIYPYFTLSFCEVDCNNAKSWKSLNGMLWYFSPIRIPGVPGDGNCVQFVQALFPTICNG